MEIPCKPIPPELLRKLIVVTDELNAWLSSLGDFMTEVDHPATDAALQVMNGACDLIGDEDFGSKEVAAETGWNCFAVSGGNDGK